MSNKAETMELMLLDEAGQFVASLLPAVTAAPEFVKFENRHYRRTGKLRDSPEEWQYDRSHTVSGRKDCVVFVGDSCPVWRTGDPKREGGTREDAEAQIAALTTDRDVLRLEVQRLKDLNHESQDLYAAIEAERDELRRNLDAQSASISWEQDARLWRSKAESYLRVIDGMQEAYSAALTMLFARVKAGLPPLPLTLSRDAANAGLELPEEPDNA